MEINQISQLLKTISAGATQSSAGILGNDSIGDASSSFEALLNQIVNSQQDQALNNDGTSIPSIDTQGKKVSGLDNLTLQSQRAEQLQQMVMQQMMQIMTMQDTDKSSSIGSTSSGDSSESLFPSFKGNNGMIQLLQTIVQEQASINATDNMKDNISQVNAVLSKSNI